MIMQMNDPYSISNFFILLVYYLKITVVHIREYNFT